MYTYKCNFCKKDFQTTSSKQDTIEMIYKKTGQRMPEKAIGMVCNECLEKKKTFNVNKQLAILEGIERVGKVINEIKTIPLKEKLEKKNVSVSDLFN